MKNYTITVNGNVYDVTVEENGAGAAPKAVSYTHRDVYKRQVHHGCVIFVSTQWLEAVTDITVLLCTKRSKFLNRT